MHIEEIQGGDVLPREAIRRRVNETKRKSIRGHATNYCFAGGVSQRDNAESHGQIGEREGPLHAQARCDPAQEQSAGRAGEELRQEEAACLSVSQGKGRAQMW